MRLIIAGSRTFTVGHELLYDLMRHFKIEPDEIVTGCADGVDRSARGLTAIPVKIFEADWISYGKAAGPIRNREMAKYADKLLLVWDGESRGSRNMREEMLHLKKPVFEVIMPRSI